MFNKVPADLKEKVNVVSRPISDNSENISKAINLFKENLVNISAMMKNDNNCPPSQKSIKPIKIERTTRTSKPIEL